MPDINVVTMPAVIKELNDHSIGYRTDQRLQHLFDFLSTPVRHSMIRGCAEVVVRVLTSGESINQRLKVELNAYLSSHALGGVLSEQWRTSVVDVMSSLYSEEDELSCHMQHYDLSRLVLSRRESVVE